MKIIIAIMVVSALFAGCLSEKNTQEKKDVILDLEPSSINLKSGEVKQVKIRVNNSGISGINPVVRFNVNSSDKPYLNFTPGSYDLGYLRPGEDSGFRLVDVRATLAAGEEIKYHARAQVIYNGKVFDSKDLIVTVAR
ncbi:Uncharacterised protein [uncultured archaeon]|nr:Uncharacterised protein [uncultured archaeon]